MNPQIDQRYNRVQNNFPGDVQKVRVTDVVSEEWDDAGTLVSDWRVKFEDLTLHTVFGMPLWQFRHYFRPAN
jgi:hypothetical protein